ncbi:MAG: phosphopantetheine-binding protein [bacterium]
MNEKKVDSDGLNEIIHGLIYSVQAKAKNTKYDEPLFSSGLLDSFAVIEIIAKLEQRFNIVINTNSIEITQLDSIMKIRELVVGLKKDDQ